MKNNTPLPAHIRQLVDKKNFVIAIKTLAEEQNISMEEAKNKIDEYEASTITGIQSLQQGLDNHLKQENIKVPLIPRWVWRVTVIIVVMVIIGLLIAKLFK